MAKTVGAVQGFYTCDPPEEIARCLSCDKPDCTNCIHHERVRAGMGRGRKTSRFDYAELERHYKMGLADADIAEAVGCSKPTVCRWRGMRGLRPNKGAGR